MSADRANPVLVVGAGPVGLTVAALLSRLGVPVRVVDGNGGPTDRSKAIGIHARTLECLHALGITDALIAQGNPMHRFRIHQDGEVLLASGFADIDAAYPFVLGLPQSRTERALLASLAESGADVEWGTELIDLTDAGEVAGPEAPTARLRKNGVEEVVACRWVVGCDGGRSTVRARAGISFPGGDYGSAFILGDVEVAWAGPLDELQFFLGANGYLLLIPMPDGMHRVIAQTGKQYAEFSNGERSRPPSLADLQEVVDRNGPAGMRVHSPVWITEAPFYHRLASTAIRGRTLLAGDAMHLFSPLGAQGLNTGLQDACNLAWKIAFVEHGWASPDLLDTYAAERRPVAELVATFTGRTTRFITGRTPAAHAARRRISGAWQGAPFLETSLPSRLAGLEQHYDQTALTSVSDEGLPRTGKRFPHAWVAAGAGYVPLAQLLHGNQFTLLLTRRRVDEVQLAELDSALESWRERGPFLRTVVLTRDLAPETTVEREVATVVRDVLGSVFAAVGNDPACLLFRPDGVTALAVRGWRTDAVLGYFDGCGLGLQQLDVATTRR